MNDEKLKSQLGANIVAYRKRCGMTQAKLAEQLNYSDKAVSKWERGESIPDVLTLVQLAELFDTTVDALLADPEAFVVVSSLNIPKSWIAFVYAIPVDAIVQLSLRSAWHDFRWNKTLISIIVWGAILSIYMTLLLFGNLNIWKLFLLGIPGQAAIFLWFRLYRKSPKEENNG